MMQLRAQKRTGLLNVDAEGARTFVYIKEGIPIFAEEGSAGETLGRLLVRLKLLTHEQYLEVLSKMTEAMFFNEQIRFGETAVELGYLGEEEVQRALYDQVRWKVVRCFQRSELEWTFQESSSHVEDVAELPMSIEALVFIAMLWLDAERRGELALDEVMEKYALVPEAERASLAERLGLDDDVAKGLGRLGGRLKVKELIARGDELNLEPLIGALRMLGLGRFSDQAAREEVRAPAPPPAPFDRVVTHRQSTPIAFDRRRTSRVLAKIGAERPSSKQDDADLFREPATQHERRLLGEQAFQRGRAHLAAERNAPASRALKRAAELAPENEEYALLALWCDTKNRLWVDAQAQEQVRTAATTALRHDPNLAFGYFVLGSVAFTTGDLEKAKRYFSRALVLDSSLTDAARHLRLVQGRLDGGRGTKA